MADVGEKNITISIIGRHCFLFVRMGLLGVFEV